MAIEQINIDLIQIENLLFFDSLYGLDLDGLTELQEDVKRLKEDFLRLTFIGLKIEEVEETRFRLLEADVNIALSIKGKRHEEFEDEIRQLEELYHLARTA